MSSMPAVPGAPGERLRQGVPSAPMSQPFEWGG